MPALQTVILENEFKQNRHKSLCSDPRIPIPGGRERVCGFEQNVQEQSKVLLRTEPGKEIRVHGFAGAFTAGLGAERQFVLRYDHE